MLCESCMICVSFNEFFFVLHELYGLLYALQELYELYERPLCGVHRRICCVGGVVAVERGLGAGEEGEGPAPGKLF